MEQTNHNFLNGGGQTGISDRMRELLSRAAQDHLSEQKSQGAVTEEMRQRLEGMEWLLREFREREFSTLAEAVATVQARVDELSARPPEWAETLAEHIEQVGERVKPLAEMPELRSDVEKVQSRLDTALGRLQGITETALRTANQVDSLHERMESFAAGVEARLTQIDEALASLASRGAALETSLEAVGERIDRGNDAARELATEHHALLSGSVEEGRATLERAITEGREAIETTLQEHRDALTTTVEE
ncbi:hypothetical protein SAMN02745673_04943, partial [Marinactinospora thermotolerans DSM 45154]